MKKIFITLVITFSFITTFAQNKEADAAKLVLKQYKDAVEKLDVTGTENFFTTNSKIFESGSSEGNYAHYLEHHLSPEFKEFKSFKYNNYNVDMKVDGNYAFATETYDYIIIVAKDNAEVKRNGVSTSVLKKVNGIWRIMISHNSSRK